MRILSIYSFIIALAAGFVSCKDVTEPDLTKQTISLVAPADNDSTSSSSLTFWWNKVDEQNKYTYRIQIVKPNFTSPQMMVLDSTTTNNKYTMTLDPGRYQWRVRVENNSSSSPYSTVRSFRIDSSLNISSQKISPIFPLNNTPVITSTSVAFQWQPLANATYYYLYLYKVESSGVITSLPTITNIYTNTYTYNFASYGTYQWRVMGLNSTSNSSLSDVVTYTLAIPAPVPVTNADSNTVGQPLTLNWNWSGSSTVGDSLIIYKDFQNISSQAISTYITTKTYAVSSGNSQTPAGHTYYWKIKSLDASGNSSVWVPGPKSFKLK